MRPLTPRIHRQTISQQPVKSPRCCRPAQASRASDLKQRRQPKVMNPGVLGCPYWMHIVHICPLSINSRMRPTDSHRFFFGKKGCQGLLMSKITCKAISQFLSVSWICFNEPKTHPKTTPYFLNMSPFPESLGVILSSRPPDFATKALIS